MTYAELVAPIANRVFLGSCEAMDQIPDGVVHSVVTSPPYFRQRGYLEDEDPAKPLEIGQESLVLDYVAKIVEVFREVRRVLRDDGTVFLNIGDCYASAPLGSHGEHSTLNASGKRSQSAAALRGVDKRNVGAGIKSKDLIGVPWAVAFALRADGWFLRDEIIWHKPNPRTSSALDRCTNAHEKVFMLAKAERYFSDMDAVRSRAVSDDHGQRYGQYEPAVDAGNPNRVDRGRGRFLSDPLGANLRNVWTIATAAYRGDHHAVMPFELAVRCIKIGTSEGGCCAECGTPRRRLVDRQSVPMSDAGQRGTKSVGKLAGGTQVRADHDVRDGPTTIVRTLGFARACDHDAPTMASLVADPFAGTGTTGHAAEFLGLRMWTGYELNENYVGQLSDRTRQIGLFSA